MPVHLTDLTFDKYDKEVTNGLITPQELYLKLIEEYAPDADPSYDFLSSWLSDYRSITQTYNIVEKLSNDCDVGLFSNIYKGMVPEMVKRGLIPQIQYAYQFLSCDIGMQKPDIQFYSYVTRITGLNGPQILFIDDKKENLVPAEEYNWRTFNFNYSNPEKSADLLSAMLF